MSKAPAADDYPSPIRMAYGAQLCGADVEQLYRPISRPYGGERQHAGHHDATIPQRAREAAWRCPTRRRPEGFDDAFGLSGPPGASRRAVSMPRANATGQRSRRGHEQRHFRGRCRGPRASWPAPERAYSGQANIAGRPRDAEPGQRARRRDERLANLVINDVTAYLNAHEGVQLARCARPRGLPRRAPSVRSSVNRARVSLLRRVTADGRHLVQARPSGRVRGRARRGQDDAAGREQAGDRAAGGARPPIV